MEITARLSSHPLLRHPGRPAVRRGLGLGLHWKAKGRRWAHLGAGLGGLKEMVPKFIKIDHSSGVPFPDLDGCFFSRNWI